MWPIVTNWATGKDHLPNAQEPMGGPAAYTNRLPWPIEGRILTSIINKTPTQTAAPKPSVLSACTIFTPGRACNYLRISRIKIQISQKPPVSTEHEPRHLATTSPTRTSKLRHLALRGARLKPMKKEQPRGKTFTQCPTCGALSTPWHFIPIGPTVAWRKSSF